MNGKILTGKKIKETNEMQMRHEAKKVKQMWTKWWRQIWWKLHRKQLILFSLCFILDLLSSKIPFY